MWVQSDKNQPTFSADFCWNILSPVAPIEYTFIPVKWQQVYKRVNCVPFVGVDSYGINRKFVNRVNKILPFVLLEKKALLINPFSCALWTSQHLTSCVTAVLSKKFRSSFCAVITSACGEKGVYYDFKYPIKVLWWIDWQQGEELSLYCDVRCKVGEESRHSSVPSTWMQPGGSCLGHAIDWHGGHIMQELHHSAFI